MRQQAVASYYFLPSSARLGDTRLVAPDHYSTGLILADWLAWATEHGWSGLDTYSIHKISEDDYYSLEENDEDFMTSDVYTRSFEFVDKIQKMKLTLRKKP